MVYIRKTWVLYIYSFHIFQASLLAFLSKNEQDSKTHADMINLQHHINIYDTTMYNHIRVASTKLAWLNLGIFQCSEFERC